MKILLLALTLIAFTQSAYSQTKLIAHKSHSGSSENFHKELKSNGFDSNSSNFGQAPNPVVRTAVLDTLKYISDSVSVMITSDYCTHRFRDTTLYWGAGTDTLYSHPLFSRKHDLDSIKTTLRNTYYFKNSVDSVVFIGYDQSSRTDDKSGENRILSPFSDTDNLPPSNLKWVVFSGVLLLSLFIGFIGKSLYANRISFGKE